MPEIRQAVILAGGRGTRMRPLTDALPKPMIDIGGRPFIQYVVEMFREQGIERILFLLGYLPTPLVDYFGDGSRFNLRIDYSITSPDDETGTRLRQVRERVDPNFLLTYSDNYWPAPLAALERAYQAARAPAMLTVYRNRDGYTRDNVRVAGERIVTYDRSRSSANLAGVDIGFGLFDARVLDLIPSSGNPSFEGTVYERLVAAGELAAFETDHRYYSIGSLDRIPLTTEFFRRRKTVLIDRDGTLNVRMARAEYVTSWNRWQWIPGALRALASLTAAGYRIVIITNQPGVARGALTAAQLEEIHERMIAEAAAAGATIDAVLACPHDWDEGCLCRKPAPGLLFQAQRDFSLDLTATPFIGDDDRDGQAAAAAGAPFKRVTEARTVEVVVDELLAGDQRLASVT